MNYKYLHDSIEELLSTSNAEIVSNSGVMKSVKTWFSLFMNMFSEWSPIQVEAFILLMLESEECDLLAAVNTIQTNNFELISSVQDFLIEYDCDYNSLTEMESNEEENLQVALLKLEQYPNIFYSENTKSFYKFPSFCREL